MREYSFRDGSEEFDEARKYYEGRRKHVVEGLDAMQRGLKVSREAQPTTRKELFTSVAQAWRGLEKVCLSAHVLLPRGDWQQESPNETQLNEPLAKRLTIRTPQDFHVSEVTPARLYDLSESGHDRLSLMLPIEGQVLHLSYLRGSDTTLMLIHELHIGPAYQPKETDPILQGKWSVSYYAPEDSNNNGVMGYPAGKSFYRRDPPKEHQRLQQVLTQTYAGLISAFGDSLPES